MKRYKHNLSRTKLLSFDPGYLVPIGLLEVLPGDTMQQASNALLRVTPLLAPLMHKVDVRIHHWFVPHRIVWDDFEDFITGNATPQFPVLDVAAVDPGSLLDYYGVPTHGADSEKRFISALPIRGYKLIFNNYYRDQDLQTEEPIGYGSGVDTTTISNLLRVSWEKDYFTTARPWAQKGSSITIPSATSAPVTPTSQNITIRPNSVGGNLNMVANTSNNIGHSGSPIAGFPPMYFGTQTGLQTDLSNAMGTINELRTAFALMRYEEARARYGSRYTEYLRYLGVRSSDARLQLPEYLGGGKNTIQFSEVLQTGEGANPVGEMRGHGIASMRSNKFRRFFEEHGYVHTFISVRPKTIYGGAIDRTWLKTTKEDFFQKELAHIGQQEITNKEVYYAGPDATASNIFGWQDRYSEYRQGLSGVSGEFRTSTLDFWHMSRMYNTIPTLNSNFIVCDPTDRVYAVPSTDKLYAYVNHSTQARRMVPNKANGYVY